MKHTKLYLNKVFSVLIAILTLGVHDCLGQTSFELNKNEGHYFLTTSVNGVLGTEIFVETGFVNLTLNKDNFDKLFANSNLEQLELPDNKVLRFDNSTHDIVELYEGSAVIGDLEYRGKIMVVDSYDKVVVPFHKLTNLVDSIANLIQFDFKNNTLAFVNRADVKLDKLKSYQIVRYNPYPTFEAELSLTDTYGHEGEITGNWIFDLGNGSPMFFFRKSIAPFINENKFKVLQSKDKSGNPVGQGLYAQYCKLGTQQNMGIPIGITNRVSFDFALGCVGPSFFTKGYVLLDLAQGRIYYKK